jgi:hypothetical protein
MEAVSVVVSIRMRKVFTEVRKMFLDARLAEQSRNTLGSAMPLRSRLCGFAVLLVCDTVEWSPTLMKP